DSLSILLFSLRSPPHRDPPSFPTRRSSDLAGPEPMSQSHRQRGRVEQRLARQLQAEREQAFRARCEIVAAREQHDGADNDDRGRSEEHTSELQSRENLVCRLLLEKKKSSRQ